MKNGKWTTTAELTFVAARKLREGESPEEVEAFLIRQLENVIGDE